MPSQYLFDMFLLGDMRLLQILEDYLQACSQWGDESFIQWWARLDSIFMDFELMGPGRQIGRRKHGLCMKLERSIRRLRNYLGDQMMPRIWLFRQLC